MANLDGQNQQDDSLRYQASELLLEHLEKEYSKEDERAARFDTKVPILLTLVTLFWGFILDNGKEFTSLVAKKSIKWYAVYSVLNVAMQLCFLISVGCFVYVIYLKQYRRLRTDVFTNEELNSTSSNQVAYELIKGYTEALDNNIIENDKRAKVYTVGIIVFILGVAGYIAIKLLIYMMQ